MKKTMYSEYGKMFLQVFVIFSFFLSGISLSLAEENTKEKTKIIRLEELDLTCMHQDWSKPNAKKSVNGTPLTINGVKFENGVGSHATSKFTINLNGDAKSFHAQIGVDDEVVGKPGSVVFKVYVDEKKIFESPILKPKDSPIKVNIPLDGAKRLDLIIRDGGDGIDYDHADWADAYIILKENSTRIPKAVKYYEKQKVILTPKEKPTPKINAAGIIGASVGKDFLYTIPVTGVRPIKYKVEGLPEGLQLDSSRGIITGKVAVQGKYEIKINVENDFGKDAKNIQIWIGYGIALTPPMGWNSWNCWGKDVDAEKIKAAADAMVNSGLINYGYTYINIDDCWQGERNKETKEVTSNSNFPDMKELADYVHSKGLKFGVYTDAGTKTCAGYEGSKDFEEIDAKTYAKWGVDYVKCDWCNTEGMDPIVAYGIMGKALQNCSRDIVFSICNWGVKEPWKWGEQVGGNLWRTTGDIADTWSSVYNIGFSQAGLSKYAKPGHWNDPDMLVVGKLGWSSKLHDSKLTPDEQYSHISLWCLLSSPLLLGCDMSQLDEFTFNLITNDEVLAINQDILGNQAERIAKDDVFQVWAKDLSDGSKAVGIFNVADKDIDTMTEDEYTLKWETLKISGKQIVRDSWKQENIGEFDGSFNCSIPEHGVKLIKLTAIK